MRAARLAVLLHRGRRRAALGRAAADPGRRPDAGDRLTRTASRVDVDCALGAFPFEERSVERATPWEWATGATLLTCSAEDLRVHKVFAGRDPDCGCRPGASCRSSSEGSGPQLNKPRLCSERQACVLAVFARPANESPRRTPLLPAAADGTRTAGVDAARAKTTAARTWKAVA